MHWLLNRSTRSKLLMAFGLLIALGALMTALAYRSLLTIQHNNGMALELVELRADLNRNRALILEMMSITNKPAQETTWNAIKNRSAVMDDRLLALRRSPSADAPTLELLDQLTALLNDYRTTRDGQVVLVLDGKLDEARQLGTGVQEERYEAIRRMAIALGDAVITRARHTVRSTARLFLLIALLAVAVAAALAWLLNRSIAEPLRAITGVARRIASGDVAASLGSNQRTDEVGVLLQTFAQMSTNLRSMAGIAARIAAGDLRVAVTPQSTHDALGSAFAAMIGNLQRLTGELAAATNVLGTATTEIATSTTELAACANESAAAVAQTSTTVEEVRQTAQVSNQKAKAVTDSAQKAVQVAQTGRQSTSETVDGMIRIRNQMESIADSMMRLSEQTQAIGQIIASVDDLAAQSNLLAVNAAIEAAKAGEHGKGFAVVAQEIKNLAEQSKQATQQVRTILNDIQKATSAAVLATEQGTKAVAAGAEQTARAGDSIQALGTSVAEAAQAALQISASSQQQLIGMEQVATAMTSIKQATMQNAASAKQMETSVRGLGDVGRKLQELVQQYKL